MFAFLETLRLELEATTEDPTIEAAFPPVGKDDELLGTLSPSLRVFATVIDRRQKEMHEAGDLLRSLPAEKQEVHARLLSKLSLTLAAYTQYFYLEVALEFERSGRHDIWEKLEFLDFRKGWAMVAVRPISVYIVGPNPNDGDFDDDLALKPKSKRELN